MGILKGRKLFFHIAIGVELTHVSPQVFDLLLVLDARKDHFGAGNLRLGIFYVLFECRFIPNDARVLVGIGIVETWYSAGLAVIETIESRDRSCFARRDRSCGRLGRH